MTDAVVHSPARGVISGSVSRPTAHLMALATRLRQALQRAVVAHKTRRELYGLPEEVLRDIGLTRGDIPYIALSHSSPSSRAD